MLNRDTNWRSWGRVVEAEHLVGRPAHADELPGLMAEARAAGAAALPVGLGRSYGDTNLNPGGALIDMGGLDRFMAFDPATGVLRCEAGVSLSQILRLVVPHGWFLPTTPGTRYVTVGGAIANDVHGKNHHGAGTFGAHVRRLALLRSDRQGVAEIGPDLEPDLFAATVGGLGLTGVILWAEIDLVRTSSSHLDQTVKMFSSLADFFVVADEAVGAYEHTVSWIDCTASGASLGRGLFNMANWAHDGQREVHQDGGPALPFAAPTFTINPLTLRAFNTLYYAKGAMDAGKSKVHYTQAFYPLDAVRRWNLIYGAPGFYQYQCVVPRPAAPEAMAEILKRIAKSGEGSFLAVLKTLGDKPSPGLLSFPMPGVTLAVDFRNQGRKTLDLLAALDAIVFEAGGRLYPAKDGRMSAAALRVGYPQFDRFTPHLDPALSSAFWRRISA